MKKDKKYDKNLNVFTYGYFPWSRPRNWFHNIKTFFRNIKRAWQRATRGYCDWDIYDLDCFLLPLMRDTINQLAESTHGYPGNDGYNWTYDSWVTYLKSLSEALNKCMLDSDELNQYLSEFDKMLHNPDKYTDKEKEIIYHQYRDRELEIYNEQQMLLKDTFGHIARHLRNMWD